MPIADVEKIVRHEPLDSCYEIGKELGRGKFAIVKRCTEKKTGAQYAAKILKKRRRGKSVREDILMEIDIMRQGMDHARIIKLYEVFETQNEFYIIIELALGGELFRVIAVDPLPELKARGVVFQILEGVCHLHSLNIVHMDLKPENLLLYRKNSLEIKIVDFGLAVQLQEGQEVKSLVGTAEYVSPEILSFEALSTYSDMWSIGALTYALLAGYSPFQGETHQETFLNVSTCDYDFEDEVFDVVSADAKDFIEKLLVRAPHKRLTAEQCLKHPWIKAHIQSTTNNNNLDGSMSSLDSALCMDSASSMEPSPVSSASSSFSPAPSATSHSGSGSTTTSTTTSTTAKTCATTTTSLATPASELSRPEDMRKVNEKLGQISKLATEQIIAETAEKPRPEGSPTSTASSTSTLRGEDTSEPIPPPNSVTLETASATVSAEVTTDVKFPGGKSSGEKLSNSAKLSDSSALVSKQALSPNQSSSTGKAEQRRAVSFERTPRERERSPCTELSSFKSSTLGRERNAGKRDDERRTVSFERRENSQLEAPTTSSMTKSKSATLGREYTPSKRDGEREERRTVSFERKERSPQPEQDVASLDPKTLESIERFHRLKERSKARESESYIQPLSSSKERSPELTGPRRRSDGTHLSASECRLNTKAQQVASSASATTSEEEKPSSRGSSSPEGVTTPRKTPSPPRDRRNNTLPKETQAGVAILTPPSTRKILSSDSKNEVDSNKQSASPSQQPVKSGPASTGTAAEKSEKEKVKTPAVESLAESKTVESPKLNEEVAVDQLESARKERERLREERRRARREEEKKKEEERKRMREEAERKMEEERKRMEQEREKAREVRRRERERKLTQQNNSTTSSGSSEPLIKSMDRNRWAWSVEARTSESTAHFNGVKPHPQGSESSEEPKKGLLEKPDPEELDKSPSQEAGKQPQPGRKTERKVSASEYFQFGLDYSAPRTSAKQPDTATKTSSPLQQERPTEKVEEALAADKSPTILVAERSKSPVVIVSPPPTPERRENHEAVPARHCRERSPAAEHKMIKVNRRKTPVISSDALDAILRGDVEDETDLLQYATNPNPYHPSQLESCPEEDEPQTTPPRAKSPSSLLKTAQFDTRSPSSNGQPFLAERREGVLPSALRDPNRSVSPEKRRVTLLTCKDRTQSMDLDQTLSPDSTGNRSVTASPSPEFSKSFDAGRSHGISKPSGISQLTVSDSYSSLSRSTPDLSEILGGAGKKGKDGRKIERSSSRRLGRRSRMDSYVTSTEYSSSYYQSPASPHLMKSARHATVTSRLLSGGKGFLSKLSDSKSTRQNHKVSS